MPKKLPPLPPPPTKAEERRDYFDAAQSYLAEAQRSESNGTPGHWNLFLRNLKRALPVGIAVSPKHEPIAVEEVGSIHSESLSLSYRPMPSLTEDTGQAESDTALRGGICLRKAMLIWAEGG